MLADVRRTAAIAIAALAVTLGADCGSKKKQAAPEKKTPAAETTSAQPNQPVVKPTSGELSGKTYKMKVQIGGQPAANPPAAGKAPAPLPANGAKAPPAGK